MDIQAQIQSRLGTYLESDKFESRMNEIVEKSVNDAVESLFSYGEVRDTIKQMFKDKIAINVDQIDFTHVNEIVTQIVRQKTAAAFSEPLRDKLSAKLSDMFQPAPVEITVQGLLDILREELRDDPCGCADPEKSMEVVIEKSDSGGFTLKIWNEGRWREKSYLSERRENDPSIRAYIRTDKKIALLHNVDISKGFCTGLYGFDAKIFMMYCQGTMISDIDTCEVNRLDTRINDHIDY